MGRSQNEVRTWSYWYCHLPRSCYRPGGLSRLHYLCTGEWLHDSWLYFLFISAESSREPLLWSSGIALHAARPCMQNIQQYLGGGMSHVELVGQRITGSFLQKVILDMKSRLKDPDIARLFENTFPNTLGTYPSCFTLDTHEIVADTTVKYYNEVRMNLYLFSTRSNCHRGRIRHLSLLG